MLNHVEQRRCGKCGETKSTTEFYNNNKRGYKSHQTWCKSCTARYYRERYNSDPEYRKKVLGLHAVWRRAKGIQPKPQHVCKILEAHHEQLKEDPERLTTEFLQNILGRVK